MANSSQSLFDHRGGMKVLGRRRLFGLSWPCHLWSRAPRYMSHGKGRAAL